MAEERKLVKFRQGPVWHDVLTTEQSVRIKKVYKSIEGMFIGALERFEASFLRVVHIDNEIVIWEKIAKGFQDWKNDHPGCSTQDCEKAISELYSISLGMPVDEQIKKYYS